MGSGHGKLERGHVRYELIRALAAAEQTGAALAKKYGATSGSISDFKRRHAAEIAEVRGKLDDEFAGLWVARKAARIAEYEQALEDVAAWLELPDVDEDGQPVSPEARRADPRILRARAFLLRAVAEELGQLPTRMDVQVSGEQVHYVITGDVGLEAMKKSGLTQSDPPESVSA